MFIHRQISAAPQFRHYDCCCCCCCAGFIYLPSFAHSYSVTHNPEDLRQALAAAEAMSWAFNPNSNCLRTFEGWMPRPSTHWSAQIVIIGESL